MVKRYGIYDKNMKTLYESILTNTQDKVVVAKEVIRNLPPTTKDWKKIDNRTWQLNYRCPNTIQEYINILPDDVFRITALNPSKLKKENITIIRCIVDSYMKSTSVELVCDDTPDNSHGVNLIGLDKFLSGVSVTNAKKCTVEAVNRIHQEPELFGRILKHVVDSLYNLNKYQYCNETYIWDIR